MPPAASQSPKLCALCATALGGVSSSLAVPCNGCGAICARPSLWQPTGNHAAKRDAEGPAEPNATPELKQQQNLNSVGFVIILRALVQT